VRDIPHQTYAPVRDLVATHALLPIRMKGIRASGAYAVDGLFDTANQKIHVFSGTDDGVRFLPRPNMVDTH
jgi:adenylate cyclase